MITTSSTVPIFMSTSTPKNPCERSVFHHPNVKGAVVTWQADPWAYLDHFLAGPYNRLWPLTNWRRSTVDLRCPHCGEINLPNRKPVVEQERVGTIVCASCGKAARPATGAGGLPGTASGLKR